MKESIVILRKSLPLHSVLPALNAGESAGGGGVRRTEVGERERNSHLAVNKNERN